MNVIRYICIYQHFFFENRSYFSTTMSSIFFNVVVRELVFDFKSSLQCLSVLIIGSTELKKNRVCIEKSREFGYVLFTLVTSLLEEIFRVSAWQKCRIRIKKTKDRESDFVWKKKCCHVLVHLVLSVYCIGKSSISLQHHLMCHWKRHNGSNTKWTYYRKAEQFSSK